MRRCSRLCRLGGESVSSVCARLGDSRQSYYKYLARFDSEGLEGCSPGRGGVDQPDGTPSPMVELITKLGLFGGRRWDNGACLLLPAVRGGERPPAWRTIHRVLVRQAW